MDRLLAELRAFLEKTESDGEAKALLAQSKLEMLLGRDSEVGPSGSRRLRLYIRVLDAYLRAREAAEDMLKGAARSAGS